MRGVAIFEEFDPAVKGKNVKCSVLKKLPASRLLPGRHIACGRLFKFTRAERGRGIKGSGTSGSAQPPVQRSQRRVPVNPVLRYHPSLTRNDTPPCNTVTVPVKTIVCVTTLPHPVNIPRRILPSLPVGKIFPYHLPPSRQHFRS